MPWNLPTLLTWARVVAIPLLVGVYFLPIPVFAQNLLATVLFVGAAITDWLDGWLARRWGQTSAFGAFLDPVADKLIVCVALIMLVHLERVDVIVAAIIVGSVASMVLGLWLVRSQSTVNDVAWMKAMIPHHSIAILTSERATIADPRARKLAGEIIQTQKREIAEMEALIRDLESARK